MKTYIIVVAAVLSSVFSIGQTTQTYTFTIEGMTCGACANTATQTLQSIEGVDSASVDFDSKTATVIGYSSKKEIKAAIKDNTNFEAFFEGETMIKPLTEAEKQGLDIEVIKGGNKIKFKNHLTTGKITIFDFYADWCGPCRVFSPKLEHFIKDNPNVTLRKVDIVDWKSDLSKQLTKDYKMPALPFVLIFDENGKLLGKVEGNHIELVKSIVSPKTR
ncbi:MAG: cation transporter [Flavobacteriales bacterium]|nr:cation transporter [Flavobacteriales bacterium]